MGEVKLDLIYAGIAVFDGTLSVWLGIWWLALLMAFIAGSLLTFALADWRDAARRQCGLLIRY
jgi:hypothetical protein